MNRDIDKTRDKLGVGELDTQQRKKLFKEFIDHGGEVIEKKKPRGIIQHPSPEIRAKPKEREAKIETKKKPIEEKKQDFRIRPQILFGATIKIPTPEGDCYITIN